ERGGRLVAGHAQLAHMGEVEQAGRGPDRGVLGRLASVAQRHLPAGEVGHRRTEALVHCRQRGARERLGPRFGHLWTPRERGRAGSAGDAGQAYRPGAAPALAVAAVSRRSSSAGTIVTWDCLPKTRSPPRWPRRQAGNGPETRSPARSSWATSKTPCSMSG